MSEAQKGEKNHFWGRHHSEETKKKISKSKKGKSLSWQHKRKIGEAQRGRHYSMEVRERMSAAKKGEKNPLFGKHLSEEHRRRISEATKGELNPFWKGGVIKSHGRVYLYRPDHPKANDGRYVPRSHLVWEAHNGPLPQGFIIHHKNGNPSDDRIENLEMLTNGEHTRLHNPRRRGIKDASVNVRG